MKYVVLLFPFFAFAAPADAPKLAFECTVSSGDKVVASPKLKTLDKHPFEVATGTTSPAGKPVEVKFEVTPHTTAKGIETVVRGWTVSAGKPGDVTETKQGNPLTATVSGLELRCTGKPLP